MRILNTLIAIAALLCATVPAPPQTSPRVTDTSKSYERDIDATKQWVDTNIDLHAGEKLHITATGTITTPRGHRPSHLLKRLARTASCAAGRI